jgi:hypothetical protein
MALPGNGGIVDTSRRQSRGGTVPQVAGISSVASGSGSKRVAHRVAVATLVALTLVGFAVLGGHLLAWVNAGAVSVEDGGYAQFELTPIVVGAGVGFAVAAVATLLAFVLPRRTVVWACLVAAAALVLGVGLGVGFTASSARSNPYAALRETVGRLHFPSALHAAPITSTTANNDAPAVQTSWQGGAGSLDCTGIKQALAQAFPGAVVSPEPSCGLLAMWNGRTIFITSSGVDPPGSVKVQLLAYLTY